MVLLSGDEEIIQMFVDESREHLADIEDDILAIEQKATHCPEDIINKTFRAVHTIKGSSSFFGLHNIKNLAHAVENVLGNIRSKDLVPDADIIAALLEGTDTLKSMINNLSQSQSYDVSDQIQRLLQFTTELPRHSPCEDTEHSGIPVVTNDGELITHLSPAVLFDAQSMPTGGRFVYLLRVDVEADSPQANDSIEEFVSGCKEFAAIVDTIDTSSSQGIFHVVIATNLEREIIEDLFELPREHITIILSGLITQKSDSRYELPDGTQVSEPGRECFESAQSEIIDAFKENSPPACSPPDTRRTESVGSVDIPTGGQQASSLRVNITTLDKLMTLAGELVLTRNQLVQKASNVADADFLGTTQLVDSITSELQEAIMSTRMQSIGVVFNKFRRIVRDISRSLGKEVELQITGEEVELDKSIIEIIGDPMTHLVRNSVDHGIETPGAREASCKPAHGILQLKASHVAGQVLIEIIDDGAGIDPEKIKAKALSQGMLDENALAKMSKREILKLIFRPGFSTAEEVTDISGRGVGMDVVQSNLSMVGGAIDIESTVGRGTAIRITLPLTLAIIPSILVSVEQENYAIPQANLVELVRLPASKVKERIMHVGEAAVLRLRDQLLPLVRISDLLGVPRTYIDPQTAERKADRRQNIWDRRSTSPGQGAKACMEERKQPDRRKSASSAVNIVVVAAGEDKYGLIVNEMLDSAEIFVKPLGYHLCDCRLYAGATILGDGTVALILDVVGMRDALQLHDDSLEQVAAPGEHQGGMPPNDFQSFLIVENAPGEFFAIPLGLVSRIEKFSTSLVSSAGGRTALPYRGESLPVFRIDDVAQVEPGPRNAHTYAIVYQAGGREVGLLVSDIIDVIEYTGTIDEKTHAQPGVLGSAIINGAITLMLDLFAIAQCRASQFSQAASTDPVSPRKNGRLLIVDDSTFYINLIKAFTEDAGYEVVTATDGREGLAALRKAPDEFDVVLTDIEMPHMNGIEFTREIRKDQHLKHIPVIAVTSVTGDKAQQAGLDAGVNEYLIKLDRDKILHTCARYSKANQEA